MCFRREYAIAKQLAVQLWRDAGAGRQQFRGIRREFFPGQAEDIMEFRVPSS
jgi:hypothetical protein